MRSSHHMKIHPTESFFLESPQERERRRDNGRGPHGPSTGHLSRAASPGSGGLQEVARSAGPPHGQTGKPPPALKQSPWASAKLLYEAQAIHDLPVACDLSAFDLVQRLSRKGNALPGGRQIAQVSRMRPRGAPPHRNPFFHRDHLVDRKYEIRERRARVPDTLLVTLAVQGLPVPRVPGIRMDHIAWSNQPFDGPVVAVAPDKLVQPGNHGFAGGEGNVGAGRLTGVLHGILAYVLRPPLDERCKPLGIAGKQRATGFLIVGPITRHA